LNAARRQDRRFLRRSIAREYKNKYGYRLYSLTYFYRKFS
jgi:hypothetical protein